MDPTLQSLADLRNPDLYVCTPGVPIFRAHKRIADGKVLYEVREADLPEIAKNAAQREAEDGVPIRCTDGHILQGKEIKEKDQPPFLGYFSNARYGTFGPKNIPCVMADRYILREKADVTKMRPFRSAEYYAPDKSISGVALLVRDPALDMGIVNCSREGTYFYAMENTMPDAVVPIPPKPDDNADDFSPDEITKYERMAKYFCKKGYMKYEAPAGGAGFPSGTSTIPAGPKEATNNARTADPQLYAKLEQAERTVATLIEEREREKCQAIVDKLKMDYQLDEARELKVLLVMTSDERRDHEQYVRNTYRPTDSRIDVYERPPVSAGGQTEEETMKRAVSVASRKGIDYDDALTLVKSGKA